MPSDESGAISCLQDVLRSSVPSMLSLNPDNLSYAQMCCTLVVRPFITSKLQASAPPAKEASHVDQQQTAYILYLMYTIPNLTKIRHMHKRPCELR